MKSSDLIAVATFRSPEDAQSAKGILDVAGIESLIQEDQSALFAPPSKYNTPGAFPKNAVTQLLVRDRKSVV